MAKRLLLLFLVCSSLAGALGAAELVTRFAFFSAEERGQGAPALWHNFQNSYLRSVEAATGCVFTDTIVAHPFLSYVARRRNDCFTANVNNAGIMSRYDMPRERDPDYFTVLLVGGSVANGLYTSGKNGLLLEKFLNDRYVSPNGKPFRVMGGSVGGWALPQQYVFASLYASSVDAIVELDGYNEAANVQLGQALDTPNFVLYQMAARPDWATAEIRRALQLQRMRKLIYTTPLLRHSFLAFFSWRKLVPQTAGNTADTPQGAEAASFQLPEQWPTEKKNEWNKARYKMYLRMMGSLSRTLGVRYAHFLQPMLSLEKPLSEEEKKIAPFVTPTLYRDVFLGASSELRAEGFPSISLSGIYSQQPATVYADQVHPNAEGYRAMAVEIVRGVGELWKLRKKGGNG